jgi:hypothetical protein
MPELQVFVHSLALGFIGSEIFRAAFYLSIRFSQDLYEISPWINLLVVLSGFLLCVAYAAKRGAAAAALRIARSRRLDLLLAVCIGIWSNELTSPWLSGFHAALKSADSRWAAVVCLFLGVVLLSPLVQLYWRKSEELPSDFHFITDEEIADNKYDLLGNNKQAESFAKTVLASGARPGIVFGIEGPWGVGKTSFVNLAERYWAKAEDQVIVFRFEPLRYASEPDLTDRLIRDLSATIQSKVFTPDLGPALSRYSALLKGKADISFLGFNISLVHPRETAENLLDEINDTLCRIRRRVIIVIDDLDRLDAKATNNVLFTTRRTLKLSQATYVLCYDAEILAKGGSEGSQAREFLEKFITVKLSLFVENAKIRDFLLHDWESAERKNTSIPTETMIKLDTVVKELAEILDGESVANYLPILGDIRKVKRFLNALLMIQINETDFIRTDFNRRDLINLILLHQNYPWLFRQIYAQEAGGRSGYFSLTKDLGKSELKNTTAFEKVIATVPNTAAFLMRELFDVGTLNITDWDSLEESFLRSRACVNTRDIRTLESYWILIVHLKAPEPQDTFVLYQQAVSDVRNGELISSVLGSGDFDLKHGEKGHYQFWCLLTDQSHNLTIGPARDAIDTLINYLPRYSLVKRDGLGLRDRSIFSLLQLLDRAGWGRTDGRREVNSNEHVIEIARWIFGKQPDPEEGLIARLTSPDRGILGWNDLMLFRLHCSADRGGGLSNLMRALILDQDEAAATNGDVSKLAIFGMRKLSQNTFSRFKDTFITPRRNFLVDVDETPAAAFLGLTHPEVDGQPSSESRSEQGNPVLTREFQANRNTIKFFVIYQLSNQLPPTGSGVGCGYYDEEGVMDDRGIAKLMNDYVLNTCFNPEIDNDNALLFLDFCLTHLTLDHSRDRWIPVKVNVVGGLDPRAVGCYWQTHRAQIYSRDFQKWTRCVSTLNYDTRYCDYLDAVFQVLDDLVEEVNRT